VTNKGIGKDRTPQTNVRISHTAELVLEQFWNRHGLKDSAIVQLILSNRVERGMGRQKQKNLKLSPSSRACVRALAKGRRITQQATVELCILDAGYLGRL
jgi:hypothetical protein